MSLFSVLNVSGSGMTAQRLRAEVIVQNLANADTTRTPEGGPYRRKDVVFEAILSSEMHSGAGGVEVAEIRTDDREPVRRYIPGHPDADHNGYVAMPRVNPAEDMVDLLGASRGYQANVAAVSAVKDMIQRSIDLLR